uniref:Nascent polypeptide-associated complex subunit alpha-like UBA domain-containing protein n=1 Tax=Erythrolobus australicus TaxID=1077150 RepID=A0A7S1TKX5_9RHOD
MGSDAGGAERAGDARGNVQHQASVDLDRVTDYVEERELDADKFRHSMNAVLEKPGAKRSKDATDKELAAVKVSDADVQMVAKQFDLDPRAAERALREARGNVEDALRALLYK